MGAYLAGWHTSRPVHLNLDRYGDVEWELENEGTVIYGVWDLPMRGNERFDIERWYQRMSGGPDVIPVCWEGTFVQRGDLCCQLLTRNSVHGVLLSAALPTHCVLGARTSTLDEFSAQHEHEQQPSKIGGPGFAAWLKDYKLREHMSENQIAERTGLANKTVRKICEGKLVTRKTWNKLVDELAARGRRGYL